MKIIKYVMWRDVTERPSQTKLFLRQFGDLRLKLSNHWKHSKSDYKIWYKAYLEEWQLTWHANFAIFFVKSKGLNDSCIFLKFNRCDEKFLLESNVSKLPIKWTGEDPNQPVKIQITFADFWYRCFPQNIYHYAQNNFSNKFIMFYT